MADTPPPAVPAPPRARARNLLEPVGRVLGRGRAVGLALVRRSPVRSGVVGAGLVLAVVAGGPLATRAWRVFWTLPQAGRLTLVALGLGVAVVAALWGVPLRLRQRAEQARLGSVIAAAWGVVIAVVALLVAGAWWVMGAPTPIPPDQLPLRALDAIATRAFAVVAGLGAAALLVIAYRRQRTTERAEGREDTKLFTERFTTAAAQLGDEQPPVRLAGVHALAHLADDAPEDSSELRQMCIDVLCAYLRMPYEPEPGPLSGDATDEQTQAHRAATLAFVSLREVRHTILRTIGTRLRPDSPVSWQGHDFDFTGAVFDGGDLHGVHFTTGQVSFYNTVFTGGWVDFRGAVFSGGAVTFVDAVFSGEVVNFYGAKFSGGAVNFYGAKFSGGAVNFYGAEFTGSQVVFGEVFSGGTVYFNGAEFSGGQVDFRDAEFLSGEVDFWGAEFSGSQVNFDSVRFSGGQVDFRDAEFIGGRVDFAGDPDAEPHPFPPASGACPDGLADAVAKGTPGVVRLPPGWGPADAVAEN